MTCQTPSVQRVLFVRLPVSCTNNLLWWWHARRLQYNIYCPYVYRWVVLITFSDDDIPDAVNTTFTVHTSTGVVLITLSDDDIPDAVNTTFTVRTSTGVVLITLSDDDMPDAVNKTFTIRTSTGELYQMPSIKRLSSVRLPVSCTNNILWWWHVRRRQYNVYCSYVYRWVVLITFSDDDMSDRTSTGVLY